MLVAWKYPLHVSRSYPVSDIFSGLEKSSISLHQHLSLKTMNTEFLEKVLDFLGKAKPAALVAAVSLAGIWGITECTKNDNGNKEVK